ncbi:MAG TPA: Wzz/FepE/Etk N-terminal domain-containing protein, partial [Verrucomicrobiae bacterium]|nr:Wzz/FepE/Etk N-terminal domain-containing protein [Verrucomicrobiae bacterium]
MTSNQKNSQGKPGSPAPPGIGLDDVLFTLFRHKLIILTFTLLGIFGAVVVRIVKPPLYVSKAKLMVHYVVDSRGAVDPKDPEAQNVHSVSPGAESIINSEIEILTSLDIATQVVAIVGPEKILAKKGGGKDPQAAAGVIGSGIDVVPPRSSIITVSFKHPDKEIVQPVLDAIIHTYMRKHWELHTGAGVLDEYWLKEKEDLITKLKKNEENLKKAKADAKILFVDDSKKTYETRITKVQDELDQASRELAERQAIMGKDTSPAASQDVGSSARVPADSLNDYNELLSEIDKFRRQEREAYARGLREAHPLVQTIRGQLQELSAQKSALEKRFPDLKDIAGVGSAPLGGGSTNSVGGDMAFQLAELRRLSTRVKFLSNQLTNLQAQAAQVMEAEPKIAELERQHSELQRSYDSLVARLAAVKEGA